SFHVNREKGFFHCFGCGVGGDVIKFVELHEKVGFPEAGRLLAGRCGLTVPEEREERDGSSAAEREALLEVHELAAAWVRRQLAGPDGSRVRAQLEGRGLTPTTVERLGLGWAPSSRDGLATYLRERGVDAAVLVRSGLVRQGDRGELLDRFRNRLMIP